MHINSVVVYGLKYGKHNTNQLCWVVYRR